ncbi:MAG: M13 family metallopeptidase, partial [Amphiplicatus sp.]
MKLFLLAGAVALVLAACGGENAEKKTQDDRSIGAASQAERPEFGDWGVETVYISASAKPGDDFYRYVNAGWLDSFKIPDDFSSYGAFTVLFERSEERINKIIEDAASGASADGTSERKIGDYFASFNDVDAINAKGLETIAPDLAFIDALASHEDVARAMARPDIGANAPFAAFVDIDSKQPDRYITHITQAGLGMPNRTYYLEQKFADKQAKYKDYVAEILALAGVEDAASKAAAIYDVEYQIALAHWTPEKRRERDLAYNLKTLEELKAFAPEAPWEAMFDEAGIGGEREFVVREYDAIQKLAKIFAETPVDVWRDYLKFHLINSYADVLPAEVDDAHFAFYGATLQGVPKQRERWKRAVAAVNDAIGEAVGKIYVERYFPPSSKSQMEALVANLSAALSERLDMLAWMSEATKAQAHKKLDKFLAKIGYPDKWRDYSDLIVVRGDAYGNAKRAREFEWRYEAAKLGQPIDKTEWGMTPQTVNAYYSPPRNEIVFPAAILQAPFFDPNADAAVNYGGIGAVIGHEISHGFDDQGRKSNGDGKLEDWW